ncbi:hypothetical protein, partial [Escherichia coli]
AGIAGVVIWPAAPVLEARAGEGTARGSVPGAALAAAQLALERLRRADPDLRPILELTGEGLAVGAGLQEADVDRLGRALLTLASPPAAT